MKMTERVGKTRRESDWRREREREGGSRAEVLGCSPSQSSSAPGLLVAQAGSESPAVTTANSASIANSISTSHLRYTTAVLNMQCRAMVSPIDII